MTIHELCGPWRPRAIARVRARLIRCRGGAWVSDQRNRALLRGFTGTGLPGEVQPVVGEEL